MYGVTMAGAIGFIGWLALQGRATSGDVFLGVMITRQAIGHVEMAATLVAWLAELSFVGERYLWMLEYEPDVKVISPDIAVPPPLTITHGITFNGVSFTYPGTDKQVLEDINLHIPSGRTVALVGENGAGKSTIVKLLARFYDPTEGYIEVDGVRLTEMDPGDWREVVAASFQDFVRFQLIAREAVGIGDIPAMGELDRVNESARFAGADRVVDKLPNKMETQLGREFPEGTDLSEGEWQRIALARGAMLREPALICLDEPTASLDARAEHEVFEKFAQMSKSGEIFKPITLLVSHRFSTVRMADMIVVIADGKITEIGSHDELMASGESYAELFNMQASRYD
jgi:ATP-binding cassette subfamily B protein